jgi:hypothetical protein
MIWGGSMDFFEANATGHGPRISTSLIGEAEQKLGVRLPRTYLDLLTLRNGGTPKRRCFVTERPTSWARNHFQIRTLLGLGYPDGIDGEFGSQYMIQEWGYPALGVVIFDTPAGGPDTVMLDYSKCGPEGEPRVVYVDDDRSILVVADDFARFVRRLVECSEIDP